MIISRIFLTSTIFTLLFVFCHQESLHENSHLIEEDYVEYERPKETLSETIFHKKIRGLVYLPKTLPKWILDVIPFYGKNFKTQSSESSGYGQNLMSNKEGCNKGHGLSVVSCHQSRNPRAWILPFWSKTDLDSLKQSLCLAPDKKMVGTKKVAKDKKSIWHHKIFWSFLSKNGITCRSLE